MSLKPLAAIAVLAALPLPAQTPLTPGQTVTGTLAEGDAQKDGSYYDAYVIRGRPGERVLVRMNSEEIDPFLISGHQRGGEWVEETLNDNAGANSDARVIAYLGDDGRVELRATTTPAPAAERTGRYTLSVTLLGEPSVASIRPGQTMAGRLETTDHEGVTGFEDHYRIEGAPGDTITIHVESTDFDPVVAVRTDTTYAVAVDTVAWTDLFTDSAAVMPYLPLTIAAGERVKGILGQGTRDEDGRWFEHFIYSARAGERLRISLISGSLDARLAVGTGTDCRFHALAVDDDAREGSSALDWTAPASDEYSIRVTAIHPGARGIFVLRVDPVP